MYSVEKLTIETNLSVKNAAFANLAFRNDAWLVFWCLGFLQIIYICAISEHV